jgi:hypothetical protein
MLYLNYQLVLIVPNSMSQPLNGVGSQKIHSVVGYISYRTNNLGCMEIAPR